MTIVRNFDGDEPRITVVCDQPSHAPRTVHVVEFHRRPDGWRVDVYGQRSKEQTVWLGYEGTDETFKRFRVECRLCGLTVTAQGSTMDEVLDRLATHGVGRTTLAALAAMVN